MTPAVFSKDMVDLLITSGWQKFLLDDQFNLSPPCDDLAQLCQVEPHALENHPLINIFSPPDRENLRQLLTQLVTNSAQATPAVTLKLDGNTRPESVELMLYVNSNLPQDAPKQYTGFIRSLTNLAQETTLQNKLKMMAQVSRCMATSSDLETLLDNIAAKLHQDFEYPYVSIFLADTQATTLTLTAVSGTDRQSIAATQLNLPVTHQTVIGRVMATGNTLLVEDLTQEDHFPLAHLPATKTELAVPLIAGNQLLGILDVQSNTHNYNDDDIFLLETLAAQLAVTIDNIRLLEERDHRMAELITFNQIGLMISEYDDLQTIFSSIVQRIRTLFQVEAVSLLLLEADKLRFIAASGSGAEDIKTFTLQPGQGIAWSVVETHQTIRVDNVKVDSRHFSGIDTELAFTTRSLLAVPIQIQDRVLGVIEAVNRLDGYPFSPEDEVTLEFIVASVAIVIENARLFGQLQHQVDRMEGLLEASHAVNTLDLQDILDTIVQRISNLLQSDHTVVYLADYEIEKINATAVFSSNAMSDVPTPSFNFEQGTVGWVLEHRQPLIINDVSNDERFIHLSPQSQRITNLVSTPLMVKGEAIGVLEVAHKAGGKDFTQDDMALLAAFADQAAIAIHNARLFQEINQRLAEVSTLYTLADQLTKGPELEHVVESSVTILKHALDCNDCCLFLKQQTDIENLVLKTCDDWSDKKQHTTDIDYLTELANTLLTKPSPVYIENVAQEKGNEPKPAFNSVMMMPLMVKDDMLGVLSISDIRPYAFGQAEGRLLTIAAAQISTAIENSRLYDNLEQRALELEIALDEVEAANRLKSEFVENVSHELRTPLTFIKAYVTLILEGALGDIAEPAYKKLNVVSQKTEAIIRLVEDIVSLQKIEAGVLRLEPVATHELIARVADGAIASAAEHNIEIVVNSAPDLPKVWVDMARIGQVFDNLIGNALKFSPTGSKITISAARDQRAIKFSVQDNGIGISPDKLDKIFERFYQVGQQGGQYGGAGLGLTIVKQIIEAHNGHITVESEIEHGTIFSFWLPINPKISSA